MSNEDQCKTKGSGQQTQVTKSNLFSLDEKKDLLAMLNDEFADTSSSIKQARTRKQIENILQDTIAQIEFFIYTFGEKSRYAQDECL